MSKPAITVIMYCHNDEKYISPATQSILDQTLRDFEMLTIVDASTDSTADKIKQVKDIRIKHICNRHFQGRAKSVNGALEIANGKYVIIMDPDGISMPQRFEVQWNLMEKHAKIGCIGTAVEIIDENNKFLNFFRPVSNYHSVLTSLLKANCFLRSTLIFRNSFLTTYNLRYNLQMQHSADYDFMVRCSRHFEIRNIKTPLLKYILKSREGNGQNSLPKDRSADQVRLQQLNRFSHNLTEAEINLYLKLMRNDYLTDVELACAPVVLKTLRESNEELKLYHPVTLTRLLDDVLRAAAEKNQLGGWSIEKELISFIKKRISTGKTILEFGSGAGTDELLSSYTVISIEHDKDFAYKRGGNHVCVFSPLKDGWYSAVDVTSTIKKNRIDLILVDGPPGILRKNILNNLDLFRNIGPAIIFDDVDRRIDYDVMIAFCKALNYRFEVHTGRLKRFGFCTKRTSIVNSVCRRLAGLIPNVMTKREV